jgi:hypothetical protein
MDRAQLAIERIVRDLEQVERQIYDLEGAYISANADGNPVTGWKDALKSATPASLIERVGPVATADRFFSLSSSTAPMDVAASLSATPVNGASAVFVAQTDD